MSDWGKLATSAVTGHYVNLDGTPATGTVIFSANITGVLADFTDLVSILPYESRVVLDSHGSFAIRLPCTNGADIQPASFTYKVVERMGVHSRTYNIDVPFGNDIDLATVAPIAPSESPLRLVTSVNGVLPDVQGNVVIPVPDEPVPYTHIQYQPDTFWTIYHNLGRRPQVEVYSNPNPRELTDTIDYSMRADPDVNTTHLHFLLPATGRAELF